jgi:hypothetical protein
LDQDLPDVRMTGMADYTLIRRILVDVRNLDQDLPDFGMARIIQAYFKSALSGMD